MERRIRGRFGKALVPRADLLADIAAEYPIPHLRAEIIWDGAFEFDRQVGDAAPSVQRAIGKDAFCGAGLDTGGQLARIESVMTEIALCDDLLLRMKIADLIRTGRLAVLTSDTTVRIYEDDTILAPIGSVYRADRDAHRLFALVAVDRDMAAPYVRKPALLHGFHPCAKDAQGHAVFSLAGHRATPASDTASRINDHGPTDGVIRH